MSNKEQTQKQEIAWEDYNKFKKDYGLSLKNNKTFSEIVNEIMDCKGLTIEALQEKSKIDRRTICRLKSGKIKTQKRVMEYMPNMKTIIAFCVACNLDMLNTITLLESLGLSFKKTSLVDYAYCYLIANYSGKSIAECNAVLKNLGIDSNDFLRDVD